MEVEGMHVRTVYYTASNFISHRDNVVNLEEYRRKLTLAQEGSLAPKPEEREWKPEGEKIWALPPVREEEERRGRRMRRGTLMLDIWASLGVVVMTLTFTLRVLIA